MGERGWHSPAGAMDSESIDCGTRHRRRIFSLSAEEADDGETNQGAASRGDNRRSPPLEKL